MLLTTDSCVDNFIKVKWAPWQTDTTVKESNKRYRKERHRKGGGSNLSGRGTQTWCFIVSWPFKTTTIDDLFIYLWFLLINYWDIQIQVCVENIRAWIISIFISAFAFLPSWCLIFSYLLLNCLQNVYIEWYALFMTLARTVPFAACPLEGD